MAANTSTTILGDVNHAVRTRRLPKLFGAVCLAAMALTGCVTGQSEEARQVEGQQRIHALMDTLPMPPRPTAESCRQLNSDGRPTYLCLADVHAVAACDHRAADNASPYSLCLAETYGKDVEGELGAQFNAALSRLRGAPDASRASRLRAEQEQWERRRNRLCAAEAGDAPVSEQARAELTCLTRLAEPRVEHLRAMR